jgi:hypothetical protein
MVERLHSRWVGARRRTWRKNAFAENVTAKRAFTSLFNKAAHIEHHSVDQKLFSLPTNPLRRTFSCSESFCRPQAANVLMNVPYVRCESSYGYLLTSDPHQLKGMCRDQLLHEAASVSSEGIFSFLTALLKFPAYPAHSKFLFVRLSKRHAYGN